MASITVENVGVEFPIYNGDMRSLRTSLLHFGSGGLIKRDLRNRPRVMALRDVSLSIADGDRIGLVGRNGAGKTTLLRVLAGVYEPTEGRVVAEGRISSLLSITLGMDPEQTGYENIRNCGMYLGLTATQMQAKTPEIAEFTELGDYLHMPVRTYSAGMQVRLAFAIATSIDPEIVLMDEAIAAGDTAFLDKAQQRLTNFFGRTNILVIASHSTEMIRRLCNKAVLLHQGEVKASGTVGEVLEAYRHLE